MSKQKELAKNTLIIMIGKISTQFLSFFLLPLYTWTLSQRELGSYDLITTYIMLLVPVFTLQLENGVFRFLIDCRKDQQQKESVVSNTMGLLCFEMVVTSILYCLISLVVKIPYSEYVLGNIIAYALSGVALQISRGLGNNKQYSIGSFLCGLITFSLSCFFLVGIKIGVEGLFLASIIANIFLFIYLFFALKLYRFISVKFYDRKLIKKILKYSIPLIISGLAWWIVSASDKTMISIFLGNSANGIYTVATKFAVIYTSLYSIYHLSWTESAAVNIHEKDAEEYFNSVTLTSLKLFVTLFLGMLASIAIIFPWIIHSNYFSAYQYIPILLLGSFMNGASSYLGALFLAQKNSVGVANTTFYAALLNLLIDLLLIHFIGLYAAALSTFIAFTVLTMVRYWKIRKTIALDIPKRSLLQMGSVIIISIAVFYWNQLWLNLIWIFFVIGYAWYLNKELIANGFLEIKGGFSQWKKKR